MLARIVRETPWLMQVLEAVRSVRMPHACVGAGAVRAAVWDWIHGHLLPSEVADVDVAYFDAADLSRESEAMYQRQLEALRPDQIWDVVNQAAVHLWYERVFGRVLAPLGSVEDGIACWPETATAVAVWLDASDRLQILAPFGLSDLLACVVRRNPRVVGLEQFRARVERKRYVERWPRVRIVWE
jgi:uncharacterized protein